MKFIRKLLKYLTSPKINKPSDLEGNYSESSTILKNLIDNPLIGYYIIQDNRFKFVNKGWCNISGYSAEEVIDKIIPIDMVIPEDKELVRNNINKRFSGELPFIDYTFRKIIKDGSIKTIKAIGNRIIYKGRPAITGTILDISEQSKIEQKLKESEEKYRSLVENSLVGVYIIQDHKLKYANHQFCKIFGYEPDELLGKITPEEMVHKDDKAFVRNNIAKRIAGKENSLKYEFKGVKKDGSIINLRVLGTRMTYENSPAIMGVLIDTTELKETENALKESEHLFRLLLESAPYPITVIDDKMKHIVVNNAFCKLFKLTKEETIGKDPFELNVIPKESTLSYVEQELKNKGKIDNLEITLNIQDIEQKDFLYSCLRFKLKDEYLRLNAFIDITERNTIKNELILHKENLEKLVLQRTAQLDKSYEELKEINSQLENQKINLEKTLKNLHSTQEQLIQSEKMASLGLLSAGIAHEINNPLNFIHGGSIALENYFEEKPDCSNSEIESYLKAIKEGVRRTADIVTSLNHYSRSNDKEKVSCDINKIINNCLSILKSQISNNVSIKKDLKERLPNINGNEGKLYQALLNIIYNAIQAIQTSEGTICIASWFDDKNIFIKIADTGIGIPKNIINNVFDPFFTTKEPGKGTGLGLSITYNIIKEHEGAITINSKENEWTEINIVFPIKK